MAKLPAKKPYTIKKLSVRWDHASVTFSCGKRVTFRPSFFPEFYGGTQTEFMKFELSEDRRSASWVIAGKVVRLNAGELRALGAIDRMAEDM